MKCKDCGAEMRSSSDGRMHICPKCGRVDEPESTSRNAEF